MDEKPIKFASFKLESRSGSVKQMMVKDNLLYGTYDDKHMRVWDLETGTKQKEIPLDGQCSLMELRIGFVYMVIDNSVRTWDTKSQKFLQRQNFEGHEDWITRYLISGGILYTASADCTIRAWDIRSGRCVHVYQGHTQGVTGLCLHDGLLLSASADKTLRSWEAVKLSPTTLTIAEDMHQPAANVPRSEKPINTFYGHNRVIFGVTVFNNQLISASVDDSLRYWDIHTGKCIHQFNLESILPSLRVDLRITHADNIFLFSNANFNIYSWNVKTNKTGVSFTGHSGEIRSLKIIDNYLVTASQDRTVRKWQLKDGTCLGVLRCHSSPSCMLLHDWRVFLGTDDNSIFVYNLNDIDHRQHNERIHHYHNPAYDIAQHLTPNSRRNSTKEQEKEKEKEKEEDKQKEKEKETLPYFVGDLDRVRAEHLLRSTGFNSFVVRNSSVQGCLALSKYKTEENKFGHVLISTLDGGFTLQDSIDDSRYNSLDELVTRSPECMRYKPALS